MEKETLPGIYISLLTREKMQQRMATLQGEDLTYFIEQCNPIHLVANDIEATIGVNVFELMEILQEMNPDFDPQKDYYVVRHE